jgi:hypothetical protein
MFTNGEWKKERNGFMEVEEIGTKAVEEPALASKGLRTARALCAMIGGKSYHGKQRRGPERMSKTMPRQTREMNRPARERCAYDEHFLRRVAEAGLP